MDLNLDLQSVRFSRKKQGYVMLLLVFALIAVIAQTAAVMLGYDAAMHVYKFGNPIGTIVGWMLAVMVCVHLSSFFVLKGNKEPSAFPPCDQITSFFAMMGGLLAGASSLLRAWEIRQATGSVSTVVVLLALASLPTAAYFVLLALRMKEGEPMMTALGFFPVLWLAFCLMHCYFEAHAVITDPMRTLFQLSLVAMMLSFLGELKMRVGKNGSRLFFAASGAAVILGLCSALSMILLRVVVHRLSNGELLLSLAELAFSLYLFLRLYRMAFAVRKKEMPVLHDGGFEG